MGVKPWLPLAPEPVSSQLCLSLPDMMDDNKKPSMMVHPSLSSSSLGLLKIAGSPPSSDFSPPDGTLVYEKKPLPPVPSGRYSISSAFSREVSNAFQTPKGSMEAGHQEYHDWRSGEADIAAMLDKSVLPVRANRRHPNIRISTTSAFPATPQTEIVSPQPKKSVPKILRLTGLSSPLITSPSSNAPSGYNPQHKIRQLMGVDIGSDEYKWEPVSPVSPLTPTSSIYSQDGLEDTISEPGESLYTGWQDENDGYVSDSADGERPMSWAIQPGFVPKSLHINKARKTSITGGYHLGDTLGSLSPPPASHTRPAGGPFIRCHAEPKPNPEPKRTSHHPTLSSSSVDYHISAAEIAYATGAGCRESRKSQLSSSSAGSGVSQRSTISFYSTQSSTGRIQSFSSRDYLSKIRSPPPASLTAVGGAAERKESFGAGGHPLKTPYPPLKSVFDEDDDDDDVSASGTGDEAPNRRRSMMDRVFKKRHGSGGSKGSGSWTRSASRSGSRCGSSDSSSASPESRLPMNATSMARSSSTYQPGERYVVTNHARRVDGPDTPMPLTSAGGRSVFAQRTGDLMEQARAAMGGRSKEEKRRDELLRKGIQIISEETARDMRIPPPVPPRPLRPLSLVRGGDKMSGNWL